MRVGILGTGRIGATHAANFAAIDGVDVVVHDVVAEVAGRVAITTGATIVPDRDALLGMVDAVVIATPTAAHSDDVEACVHAGMPMLCEKPISLDLATTASALDLVEGAGAYLQVGFMRRFDPGFVEMRNRVASGALGDLYLIRAASHDHEPPQESYLDLCGSIFRDMHIHDFDAIRWLSEREVVDVYATGSVLVDEMFERHGDADITALTLTLEGGVLVSITGSRANPLGYDHRTEVIGSLDAACAGWTSRTPLRSADPDGSPDPVSPYPAFPDRFAAAYRAEAEAFIAAIRVGADNRSPGRAALEALRIAVAADRSRAEQRVVRIDEIATI